MTPLLSRPESVALLFGLALPYPVVGAKPGNRIDPPQACGGSAPSQRERMLARRAAMLETLDTCGDATTGELAVWVDSNSDIALGDLRALEVAGKVSGRHIVRNGVRVLLWSRVRLVPAGSEGETP